jgi:DNA polymerase-3 subunit epsilon
MAAVVVAVALLIASGHPEPEQAVLRAMLDDRAPLLAFLAFLLAAACAGFVGWLHGRFIAPLADLAAQAQIVATANREHRVAAAGAPEIAGLAAAINRLGDAYRDQHAATEARIAASNARVEEERNRLAALMSELSEGVLVCNPEGRILLYNEHARALFTPTLPGVPSGQSPVGLGRSVFAFLDRDQVAHALDKIQYGLDRERPAPVTLFLAVSAAGGLVRVRLAPFLTTAGDLAGMVLTLEDVTAAFGQEAQRRSLLQALSTGVRQSAANARAAAENLASFPDMNDAERARFTEIVAHESQSLSETIDAALGAYADALKASLSLEEMRLADLLSVIRRRIDSTEGIATRLEPADESLWVKVDSYAFAQVFGFLAERLREAYGVREIGFRAAANGEFVEIDLTWSGAKAPADTLARWEDEPIQVGTQQAPLSIHDVLERHGGEVWHQSSAAEPLSWFRFLVPVAEPVAPKQRRRLPGGGRPEYYDLDLFRNADSAGELAGRRLAELSYTVFDTETTGVEPSAGDKIISIGAVRIVNGRLLKHETYDTLVNPMRSVPRDSIRIHGIQAKDLEGQPTLGEVLPAFHRFCEDTVLVAHNAAFDMRFLELAEPESGVRFVQPVLDTLLLSAAAHPTMQDHSIEAIAERLGVAVVGRHTALGDALVTSEIFLKLVAVLADRGVVTLGEALEASRQTYYVRLQY